MTLRERLGMYNNGVATKASTNIDKPLVETSKTVDQGAANETFLKEVADFVKKVSPE